jgi:hypothetical protein
MRHLSALLNPQTAARLCEGGGVPANQMSTEGFVEGLRKAVPMTRSLVEQHLEDNFGEVRLHLLVADVRRFALASFDRGDDTVTTPLLDFLDLAVATGVVHLRNAIAVSFVEGTGWWDPVVQPFIATWPPALAAEVELQKSSS